MLPVGICLTLDSIVIHHEICIMRYADIIDEILEAGLCSTIVFFFVHFLHIEAMDLFEFLFFP